MVVLDTSVIIKWFVEEEGSEAALQFRTKHVEGDELIVVPALFYYELANVLRYIKDLPDDGITSILEELDELGLREEASHDIISEAVVLARQFEISVYDAVFVALAYVYGIEFITADVKLFEKTRPLGFVKLLADPNVQN